MMKKILIALIAILTIFAVLGCDTGTTRSGPPPGPPPGPPGPPGPPADGKDFTSVSPEGYEITLTPNQWEDAGFQFNIQAPWFMAGNRVYKDDKFTLEIEFTIDRNIDDDLLFYLVDGTVGTSEGYWRRLTCTDDDDADRIDAADLQTGSTIKKTFEFTALMGASGAAAGANMLCIETKNEAKTLDPVKITFTKFEFSRGEGAEPPEPPPPPAKGERLQFTSGADWNGIDLLNSHFEFEIDDELTVKGVLVSVPAAATSAQVLFQTGDWSPIGGWNPSVNEGATFETTITFDAADVTRAQTTTGGASNGPRLRTNGAAGTVLIIDQLVVKRGATVLLDFAEELAKMDVGETSNGVIFAHAGLQNAQGAFEVLGAAE
jgi:hypothetical protein